MDRLTVLTFVVVPLLFALILVRIVTAGEPMASAAAVAAFQSFLRRTMEVLFVGSFLLLLLFLFEDRAEYAVIMLLHRLDLIPRLVPPVAYETIRKEALDRLEATRLLSHHLRLSLLGPTDHPIRALEFWLARLVSHDPFVKVPQRFIEVSEHFRLLEEHESTDEELRETYADISLAVLGRTLSVMGRQFLADLAYEGMMLALFLGALLIGYAAWSDEPIFCIGCAPEEAQAAAALHLGGLVQALSVGLLILIMGLVYQFYSIVNGVEVPLLRLRVARDFPDHAAVLDRVERRINEGESEGMRVWVLRAYLLLAYQLLYEALLAWWEGKEGEAAAYAYGCDALCQQILATLTDFEASAELLPRHHRLERIGREADWF